MKKSLIALAVLAASGAAMAQSSVTMYGKLDVWAGKADFQMGSAPMTATASKLYSTGLVAGQSMSQTLLQSGGVAGSRWGMKGTEDLGGGLKANFQLEQGFNVDSGAAGAAALAFSRQAWVGVSGGFGAVRLGRIGTAFYDVDSASEATGASALAAMTLAFRSTAGGDSSIDTGSYATRFDNSIRYDSPSVSGFAGSFQYGFGEDQTAATATKTVGDAAQNYALNVTYANGPVTAQLGYQSEKPNSSAVIPGGVTAPTKTNTRLGVTYNFGVAKLLGSYGAVSNGNVVKAGAGIDGATTNEYQLGVAVPVSAALTLVGSYARSSDNDKMTAADVGLATATGGKRTAFGLAATYTLSKRTFLYGGYATGTKTYDQSTNDAKVSAFALGMQHNF